jgi:elongation factor P
MAFVSGNEVRVGMKLEIEGAPYIVVKSQHVKMANRRAIVQAIIKNLLTGQVLDRTFHERDKFPTPDLVTKKMTYLYNQSDEYVFMDSETYDQPHFHREMLGDSVQFLKENTEVDVLYYNDRAVSVDLPASIALAVTHTEPGVRGDTATNVTKPATLETGATVRVPLFINEGDVVRVDTGTGEYLDRVSIG